jgi:hypothetical protein
MILDKSAMRGLGAPFSIRDDSTELSSGNRSRSNSQQIAVQKGPARAKRSIDQFLGFPLIQFDETYYG